MPESRTATEIIELYEQQRSLSGVRQTELRKLRDLYAGKHWGADNPPPPGYSLTVNYIEPTVDRAVSDLLARMPGVQVMPRGVDEEARRIAEGAEGVLYRCWEHNAAPRVFRRVLWNATLLRQGIFRYWWDAEAMMARFESVTPEDFYPIYDGEDLVEVIHASRRLTSELRRKYPNLQIRPDEDRTGASMTDGVSSTNDIGTVTDALGDAGASVSNALTRSTHTTILDYYHRSGTWTRVIGAETITVDLGIGWNRVPFIVVDPKVVGNGQEARSEVEAIAELNQYLDNILSQQANIIKKYADPTIIDQGSGVDPIKIRNTVKEDGGVLPIRKDGNLRYMNWEGPQPPFLEQYERVKDAIHDLSGRPRSAYGEMATNQSGVMTNLAMSPSTSGTENRQTMLGMALVELNEAILRLFEKHAAGADLSYSGYKPAGPYHTRSEYFETSNFKGSDIKGWYRNQIKWPSVIRTDDPMFVQNVIAQVTSDPPLLPIYDAIEMLGHEDAEALLDRIKEQLEDPRFHPDRLDSAISAATAMQGTELPGEMGGFAGDPAPDVDLAAAAQAGGSPQRDLLAGLA